LRLLVSLVVSLLPAQYSRYSFLQDPRLPSLTSLDNWRQCIDHSPERALGWHALKQARSWRLWVNSKDESAQAGNLETVVKQRIRLRIAAELNDLLPSLPSGTL
jgi:hypothetical protein